MKNPNHRKLRYAALILTMVQLIGTDLTFASDLNADTPRWRKLGYTASKFLISVHSEVSFQRLAGEAAQSELTSVPAGEAKDAGTDPIVKLTLTSSFLGRHSLIDVWMKPDATVLQRASLSTGGKERYRMQRYMPQGAYSTRRRPIDKAEANDGYERWSNVSERYYTIAEAEQKLPLTEAEGLFYLMGASDLSQPGDAMKVYLFDEEGALELNLTAAEIVPIKVSFVEVTGDQEVKVSRKLDALKVHASATRYEDQSVDANFQFLGCKGDIDIYLDLERRVILQVSGRVEFMGTVNIRLKELEYASEPTVYEATTL